MDNQTSDKSSFYLVGALLLGAVLVATSLVILITSQGANTASNLNATTPQTPQTSAPGNNTNDNGTAAQDDTTDLTLSVSELGLFDGKGEKACYVAVAGTIYEIAGSSLWQNGVHTIAGREITCGQDLTEEMRGAPHGTSKLSSPFMTEVGKLQ